MSNPVITNSTTSELLMANGIFRDRTVTVAAGEVLAKNTVLGVVATGAATAGSQTTIALGANLAALIAINDGEFNIKVDAGNVTAVTGVNLTTASSLPEVVALLDAKVSALGATVTLVNGDQIKFTSDTVGATSAIALTQKSATDDLSIAALLDFADLTTVAGTAVNANLGKTVACISTGANGEDVPRFVLAEALSNATGQASADFANVQVLVEGEVDGAKLVFDNGTDTLATKISSGLTMKDALKTEGIITTTRTVEDNLDNQ